MLTSVFSPIAGKYGPEKLRMRTLFTQWSSQDLIRPSLLGSFMIHYSNAKATTQSLKFFRVHDVDTLKLLNFAAVINRFSEKIFVASTLNFSRKT